MLALKNYNCVILKETFLGNLRLHQGQYEVTYFKMPGLKFALMESLG